ncbi:MAG: aspartyl/glutamyl-tRNA amidotransferase subunit A [Christensenellaceae bacterium]|jgi:aspartyl-tRNA(Asn)/glutamyl-tRNA(Gln) amidotransferase subunit A|nr:aspartyl/glutamyl-tRNA amidotransferase subunit A [Christensenellaceae bacterium]
MKNLEFKFEDFTASDFINNAIENKVSVVETTKYFLERCKNDKKNALLEVFEKDALKRAEELSHKTIRGKLFGLPVIIKDNILYKGHISSAASKMLEDFISPYNSTVVQKLLDEDAIILGRSNMDEFAMGTTGSNSAFGITKNGTDDNLVSGGSSSGSASALASGLCLAALGTDTGGSVRLPAAWNKLVGFKPTYGSISRYGLIAFASSIEQCGIFTKNVTDLSLLYSVLSGKDENDASSVCYVHDTHKMLCPTPKIGRIKEITYPKEYQPFLKDTVEISIPNLSLSLAGYYTVATAEAASNLDRFDGVKYGSTVKDAESVGDLYTNVRTKYFGTEVKRRIITGNYNLSNENYDIYKMGTAVIRDLKKTFEKVFQNVDAILLPTASIPPVKLHEDMTDPLKLYNMDLYTVTANVTGIPSVTLPVLPTGLQILAARGNDYLLFNIARRFEK